MKPSRFLFLAPGRDLSLRAGKRPGNGFFIERQDSAADNGFLRSRACPVLPDMKGRG